MDRGCVSGSAVRRLDVDWHDGHDWVMTAVDIDVFATRTEVWMADADRGLLTMVKGRTSTEVRSTRDGTERRREWLVDGDG